MLLVLWFVCMAPTFEASAGLVNRARSLCRCHGGFLVPPLAQQRSSNEIHMCVPVYAHRAATVHLAKVYRHDFEPQPRTRQASVGHGDVLMYVLCTRPRSGLTDRTQPVRLVRLHTYVCISPHSPDRSPHVHTHINTHTCFHAHTHRSRRR